jgi:hypothetical protein
MRRSTYLSLVLTLAAAGHAGRATAQEEPAPAPPPVGDAPVVDAPGQAPPEQALPEPTPPPEPEARPSPVFTLDATLPPGPVGEPAPLEVESQESGGWFDNAEYRLFTDGYFGFNWNRAKPQRGPLDEVRAYDTDVGFGLAWVGGDFSLPASPVGGTLSLRFGPSAQRYNSSCLSGNVPCDADNGLANVKQAFGSYSPVAGLTLDFGKFDTIYGAEVAESQDNINYTRGLLYWLAQPLFHTGLRLEYEATPEFTGTLLLVNGWNNSVDNNVGKSIGVQARYATSDDMLSAAVGYLGGPEHDDTLTVTCAPDFAFNVRQGCVPVTGAPGGDFLVDRADSDTKGWRHFIDLVVGLNPLAELSFLVNADLGVDNVRDPIISSRFTSVTWWGLAVSGRYDLGAVGIGGRFEYVDDADGFAVPRAAGTALTSGTLTLDAELGPHLKLMFDNRLDYADKQIFRSGVRGTEGHQITSTLGLIATAP